MSAVVDDIDIAGKYIGASFTPFNFDSEEHQVRTTHIFDTTTRIAFARYVRA